MIRCNMRTSKSYTIEQVGIMAIELWGVPIGERINVQLHDARTRDLITRDQQRRLSRVGTANPKQRMQTAK